MPRYEGFTGRGFVMALEPQSGRIAWKYNVGPKPERLDPPVKIKDAWGEHVFQFGPATSTVWSTPSYHAASRTIFFGTDTNNAPRRPTKDDPRLDTRYACAVIAHRCPRRLGEMGDANQPRGRLELQHEAIRPEDRPLPRPGDRRHAQDLHDHVERDADPGGRLRLQERRVLHRAGFGRHDPGPHAALHRPADGPARTHRPTERTLALPGEIGGLQTGCATDGKRVYTNGIDAIQLGTQESPAKNLPPTAGRVVAISLDTKEEHWRHERPKVASVGGPPPKPVFKNVGDPVASGLAVANGVVYFTTLMSSKLVALDASTGKELREIELPPVWSGPAVSRGRVYVGTGNIVLPDDVFMGPTQSTGKLFSFGLPGEDEVSRIGGGKE